MVQAAELMQVRKIIPDLATWIQCFSIYAQRRLEVRFIMSHDVPNGGMAHNSKVLQQ